MGPLRAVPITSTLASTALALAAAIVLRRALLEQRQRLRGQRLHSPLPERMPSRRRWERGMDLGREPQLLELPSAVLSQDLGLAAGAALRHGGHRLMQLRAQLRLPLQH